MKRPIHFGWIPVGEHPMVVTHPEDARRLKADYEAGELRSANGQWDHFTPEECAILLASDVPRYEETRYGVRGHELHFRIAYYQTFEGYTERYLSVGNFMDTTIGIIDFEEEKVWDFDPDKCLAYLKEKGLR